MVLFAVADQVEDLVVKELNFFLLGLKDALKVKLRPFFLVGG